MEDRRYLKTQSPAGQVWECRLLVPPDGIPQYSHHPGLPVFFYGGFLSSMASYPFMARMLPEAISPGRLPMFPHDWKTREHWFHAHKTLDPGVALQIADTEDPWQAKRLGNSRTLFQIVEGWDAGLSYKVMLEGIRLQLSVHPYLQRELLATGDRFIAEVSPTDTIWGIYDKRRDEWDGLNWLGACWMQARDELRELIR